MNGKGISRRGFLKAAAAMGAALAIEPAINNVQAAERIIKGNRTLKHPDMRYRTLGTGNAAMEVSALGFGVMGMTYNRSQYPSKEMRQRVIAEAVERGVNLFDTGIIYGPLTNEVFAGEALALGTRLLNAIKANPNEASSYPGIDPVDVNMDEYDTIIIACPLWWSQMAAPFQTFLFHYGPQMAGKNVAMIISSWSSGTSGVIADAKRLIPEGNFIEPFLWDRASQRVNASSIATWLNEIHYNVFVTN